MSRHSILLCQQFYWRTLLIDLLLCFETGRSSFDTEKLNTWLYVMVPPFSKAGGLFWWPEGQWIHFIILCPIFASLRLQLRKRGMWRNVLWGGNKESKSTLHVKMKSNLKGQSSDVPSQKSFSSFLFNEWHDLMLLNNLLVYVILSLAI